MNSANIGEAVERLRLREPLERRRRRQSPRWPPFREWAAGAGRAAFGRLGPQRVVIVERRLVRLVPERRVRRLLLRDELLAQLPRALGAHAERCRLGEQRRRALEEAIVLLGAAGDRVDEPVAAAVLGLPFHAVDQPTRLFLLEILTEYNESEDTTRRKHKQNAMKSKG